MHGKGTLRFQKSRNGINASNPENGNTFDRDFVIFFVACEGRVKRVNN